jgi:hypothetical protein
MCKAFSRVRFMRIGLTLKTQLVANKLHARSGEKKNKKM